MFGLGMGELVVIFLIIALLFGADKLPEMVKSVGKALREFKNTSRDVKKELNQVKNSIIESTDKEEQ